MPKQDSRMTGDALEFSEGFLIAIANNNNVEVREFLELEPTLIYARDENGFTAIHFLVGRGRPTDLATLRALLEVTGENGTPPDYTLADEDGHNAYHMLQLHVDAPLNHEFAAAIGIHLTQRVTGNVYTAAEYADLQRAEDEYFSEESIAQRRADLFERATLERREDDYFDRNPNHRLMDQLSKAGAGKTTIYTAFTDKPTYGDELKDLFSKQNFFYNFDDQKKFNQMNAEVDALLKDFSFAPAKPFIFSGLESDSSLIIIPQELSDVFGKIYDYFFGNHDHQ